MASSSSATKSLDLINNNFFSKQWHFFEDNTCNYLPKYYEQELPLMAEQKITFRSVSPKTYHVGESYSAYRNGLAAESVENPIETMDDWNDDLDALYEATLLSSGFLDSLTNQHESDEEGLTKEVYCKDRPLNRLRQILEHLNPTVIMTPGSSAMATVDKHQHREAKGKGKL